MLRAALRHCRFVPSRRYLTTARPPVYDMTSDTATEVTDAMFDIMKRASRKDDVFGADPSINDLEHHVAKMLGHEAALFCVSGCMTNQLGLRSLLTQPPHSVLCDARSHVYLYECGGLAYHSQAGITPVSPKNDLYLTAQDVQDHLVTDDLCGALTRVISLENTLNGTIMPLEEMEDIRELAQQRDIKVHLDGARLWNASQATGIRLSDYGGLADTISVCVSKGVGAPIGSLLVGSHALVRRARHLRKLMGGGWRQAGLLAKIAHHCIDHIVPTMPDTHRLTQLLASRLASAGMQLLLPVHTNMIFLNTSPVSVLELADALHDHNIRISRDPGSVTRIVLHHQIDSHAVDAFARVASALVQAKVDAGFTFESQDKDVSKAYPSSGQL